MKRSVQYLFLTLFLFFGLFSFYISFEMYLKGSDFDKQEIHFLSQKLEEEKLNKIVQGELNPEHGNHAVANSQDAHRSIASINEVDAKVKNKAPQFIELYFARLTDLRQANKKQEAKDLIEKIKKSTVVEDELARADYEYIQLNCAEGQLKDICVTTLDNMVSQYPTSEWTGMGLTWLAVSYKKNNRKEDSKKIAELIERDFLDSSRVKDKMKYLFKNNLIE